jgi:hypothetical protein
LRLVHWGLSIVDSIGVASTDDGSIDNQSATNPQSPMDVPQSAISDLQSIDGM